MVSVWLVCVCCNVMMLWCWLLLNNGVFVLVLVIYVSECVSDVFEKLLIVVLIMLISCRCGFRLVLVMLMCV